MIEARKILTARIPLIINILLSEFQSMTIKLIFNNRPDKLFCCGKYRGRPSNGPETQCNILKQTGL